MTFEFRSEGEEVVGVEVGFVIRASVCRDHAADRIFLERDRNGHRAARVVPDNQYSLNLFNWAVMTHKAFQKAKEELIASQVALDTARNDALKASVPAPRSPVAAPNPVPHGSLTPKTS